MTRRSLVSDLKEAFMLFDYRKNGTIASRDIGAVIRSVGLKPTEAEVSQIREEVDRSGKWSRRFNYLGSIPIYISGLFW